MKKIARFFFGLFALCSALFLCECSKDEATGPAVGEVPPITIRALRASFTGTPIEFQATFSPAIRESEVIWNSSRGNPVYRYANSSGTRTLGTDTALFDWNLEMNAFTGSNKLDTVWASFKTSGIMSNKIVISLVNHGPILDSVLMSGILINKPISPYSLGIARMFMNPSVKETLQVYSHDRDYGDSTHFTIEGIDTPFVKNRGLAYTRNWIFPGFGRDTTIWGHIKLSDDNEGVALCSLEIVVYNEIHSVWAASSYEVNATSSISKMTREGKKLFTLNKFQQVKYIGVLPVDRRLGTEAVWVVDWARKAVGSAALSDQVYILDNDGRTMKIFNGFTSHIRGFALHPMANVAYVLQGDTVKKLTLSGAATNDFKLGGTGGAIDAIDVHPFNVDEYWIATNSMVNNRTQRLVLHVSNKQVLDTLKSGGVVYDSLYSVNAIAVSFRNNLLWVASDSMVVVADLNTNTVIAKVTGFHKAASLAADQLAGSYACWVADEGNNRVVRINAKPGNTVISGTLSSSNATYCITATGVTGLQKPNAIFLDYQMDSQNLTKVLWIADNGNGRLVGIDGTNGAALELHGDTRELELEAPEAVAGSLGTF